MKITKILLSIVFISFLAISCGGGGDGDGGGGSNGQVSQQSMDEFVSFITDNVSGCTSQSVSASVKAINISSMLSSSKDMYARYQSVPAPVRAIAQAVGISEEITGICDTGSVFLTPTSESNTQVAGSININQCNFGLGVDSALIDGSLSFSLQGNDINMLDISSITASSGGITINTSGESVTTQFNVSSSFTINGSGDLSGLNATITNLSVTDNTLNEQYSLTNTSIQATGLDTDIIQINSSGTYNDPELGMFTFNTPTGLTFNGTIPNEETLTGTIQVDGTGGSDFLVTFNDDDDIIIAADVDGNGSTDLTEAINCSGLSLDTSGLPSL